MVWSHHMAHSQMGSRSTGWKPITAEAFDVVHRLESPFIACTAAVAEVFGPRDLTAGQSAIIADNQMASSREDPNNIPTFRPLKNRPHAPEGCRRPGVRALNYPLKGDLP